MFVSATASITGTATRTNGDDCTRSSVSSGNPVSPAVTCSSVLPAMRSTVRENASSTLLFALFIPTNTATPKTMPATVRIVLSTCLRMYGHVISRSRIMAVCPRRRARRAS